MWKMKEITLRYSASVSFKVSQKIRNSPMKSPKYFPDWILCPTCDQLHLRPRLKEGDLALCRQCDTRLVGRCFLGFSLPMALIVSAFFTYLVAINLPFISLDINGHVDSFALPAAVSVLFVQNMWFLASLVALFLIFAPFFAILVCGYLLFFLSKKKKPPFYISFLKILARFQALDMTDVYLASIFVVLVKATDMGNIALCPGFWAFCAQVVCLKLSFFFMPLADFWQAIDPPAKNPEPLPDSYDNAGHIGFLACHVCGLVHAIGASHCTRCKTPLHIRKPQSVDRTLALVITALVLYIPANAYPMMLVESMGEVISSTIMEGVILFWQEGSYFIAAVIFFASVAIPITKLLLLTFLVIRVKYFTRAFPMDETRIYKITEWIGKWSLIDVFVVATLAAMVQMGRLASIDPGRGVLFFAAVVIVTLFAAESFDSKLLWDNSSIEQRERYESFRIPASQNNPGQ